MPPRTPPAPARGDVEQALDRDLGRLPPHLATGTLATSARKIARRLDQGVAVSLSAALHRELRVTLAQLGELAPLQKSEDVGDELADRREARMKQAGATAP
jgi:hypothetical protein